MRPLGTSQQGHTGGWLSRARWGQVDLHLLVSEQLHTSLAMGPAVPVSKDARGRLQSGADGAAHSPDVGSRVFLPCHWHCSRKGQPRDFLMRAAYTSCRLPSASVRCSVAVSAYPVGQCSRPSG